MSSTRLNVAGTHDDRTFGACYSSLSDAVRLNPQDKALNEFFSAINRYMNGARVDADDLAKFKEASSQTAENLRRIHKELKTEGLRPSLQNEKLLSGVVASMFLFTEIDSRQKMDVPFSPTLRREVLGKAGVLLRVVPS